MRWPHHDIEKRRRLTRAASVAIAAVLAAPVAFAVIPVSGGFVGGTPTDVDVSPGEQIDPHVSGNIAAYTDQANGSGVIRYYDFLVPAASGVVPLGDIFDVDELSDVNGGHIAFARQHADGSRSCLVFDRATSVTIEIGPGQGAVAGSTALGADTVAFVNRAVNDGDIMVGTISDPSAPLVNLSNSSRTDGSPAVSPLGDAVVWESCDGGFVNCDVMKAIRSGGVWGVASVVSDTAAGERNPDTDGITVVYDSNRAGTLGGGDIFFQPLSGGAEVQISMDGLQRNPSISGGVIAFESKAPGGTTWDLFVYRISTNIVFQVTDTTTTNEILNDIRTLDNGDVRLVWAADDDFFPGEHNIYARTFAFAITPSDGGMIAGAPVLINTSAGNQTDPHVSGDIAAYTDEASGFSQIRYYDLFTNTAGAISTPFGSTDQLSDVNGVHISFARQTGLSRACMVFDVSSFAAVQIGPDNSGAFSTAIGSDTVAFVSGDDIKVGRISDASGALINLSNSAAQDSSPAVSPNGNAVVWQTCTGSSCSILKSTFDGTSWSSSVVVANAPAANTNPDTDGTSIVFDSDRAGSVDGSDIYLQPLSGGADTQISLAGAQRNPSIANGIVAFESTEVGASSADLFIYEISTDRVFQLTDTPTLDEQLNDVTVLPDGSIRVVWAAHPDTTSDNDIYAQTFFLPSVDSTAPAVTITTPADGATFVKGQSVAASYSCQDEAGGSGIASCSGTVANGDPIDTAAVGSHSFTVTGTDDTGNSATATNSYAVVYDFNGFFQPVDNLPTLNIATAGSAIPVKFSLGGNQGLSIFAAGYPASSAIACDASEPGDTIEVTVSPGGSSLSYNATTGQYTYVWKTDRAWKGTCRMLVVEFIDGSQHLARFRFK